MLKGVLGANADVKIITENLGNEEKMLSTIYLLATRICILRVLKGGGVSKLTPKVLGNKGKWGLKVRNDGV